jgi:glycosyltransferase involved in cell wall biosynthesis
MAPLKINYTFAKYQSLARTAVDYADIIKARYPIRPIEDADVIILHCLPFQLEAFFQCFPALASKHLIGYCVWETTSLSESFAHSVSQMKEIWTCSEYCRSVFAKYHPNVLRIPHIVQRDTAYSGEDLAVVKGLVSYAEGTSYFLLIASLDDRRKNTEALIAAFCRVADKMPEARLILKIHSGEKPAVLHPGIVYLDRQLTDGQMNALYSLAFAYVSPHHAEGWGLTLSDAMLFRKPVLATGYSGNLDFMTRDNSLLLGCREEYVHPADQSHLFRPEMKWAYPDEDSLRAQLLWLYEHRGGAALSGMVERAHADIGRFDRSAVQPLILGRLAQLE